MNEIIEQTQVLLVGIAGTAKDFLLSLPTLKAFVLSDKGLSKDVSINIQHSFYIPPNGKDDSFSDIWKVIEECKPRLLGFSVYVWNIDVVFKFAKLVKMRLPEVEILLGGPEISANHITAGRFDDWPVDYLIVGQGEEPFSLLLKSIVSSSTDSLSHIPRLASKAKSGFLFSANSESNIPSLVDFSSYPSPYLSGAIPASLLRRSDMRANIETQRGCNFKCAYCMYHKDFSSILYRNSATVVAELEMIQQAGITEFRITDANFFSKKKFALSILLEMLKSKIYMSVFVEIIPSFVDAEISVLIGKYILESGRTIVAGIGLQSLNEKALNAVNRRGGSRFFGRAYSLLQEAGTMIKVDLILGLPFETKKSYYRLLDYVIDKMQYEKGYVSLSLLRILPGSDMEDVAARERLTLDTRSNDHFVYCTPHMKRDDLLACLRLNAVTSRLFGMPVKNGTPNLREAFQKKRDVLKISNDVLLDLLAESFFRNLVGRGSPYVDRDFLDAERYISMGIFRDISNDFILQELSSYKK